MIKINSHTEFQPLKTLLVGSVYEDSFFDGIKNDKIREGLRDIVRTTREDLESLKDTLIDLDINVLQLTPKDLGYKDTLLEYTSDGILGKNLKYSRDGFQSGIPQPPLSIRDDCIVLGDKLVVTDPYPYPTQLAVPIYQRIFGKEFVDVRVETNNVEFIRSADNIRSWARKNNLDVNQEDIEKLREEEKLGGFCAPNLTRVGNDILVDVYQCPHLVEEYLNVYWPDYQYRKVLIGGHNDSVYSIIRPGLVLATEEFRPYADIFNGWDIIWFSETDWERQVEKQVNLKRNNSGCYWYPEKQENLQLEGFINQWLESWHGEADESIFDVNILMVDPETAVVNSDSYYLRSELEKRNVNTVVVPFRNRFFWDGGWHCNTLDIYREGEKEDYGLLNGPVIS